MSTHGCMQVRVAIDRATRSDLFQEVRHVNRLIRNACLNSSRADGVQRDHGRSTPGSEISTASGVLP